MDRLKQFWLDKALVETVSTSLDKYLEAEIIERVFKGKDITGLKETRDVVKMWLKELDSSFAEKKNKKEKEFSDAE